MTASLNVNARAVLGGSIRMPRRGAWVADLEVEGTEWTDDDVTITNVDGSLSLVGRIERADVFADRARILAIAGHGDLATTLDAKSYRNAPVKLVLQEILEGAGETLSATSSAALLAKQLPHWARRDGQAGEALAALLDVLGASWRVLPDGSVWVGTDTWPAATAGQYTLVERDTAHDRMLLAVESPRLLPATVFDSARVSLVIHTVRDDGIYTEAWFEDAEQDAGPAGQRLLAAFQRLVRKTFARVDYLAPHRAKVVAQNADLTLEVKPDSDALPALSAVPIRAGLPGVKVKVASGSRCYVEFAGGDPSQPVVTAFEVDGMTELQIGGTAPIVRQGDLVNTSIPPGFSFTATITGLANGAGAVTGPAVVTVTAAPVPLAGIAVTGSGKAKA